MAKVLVTGANGFLGSWLTKALIQQGHETYALVRPGSDLSELDAADYKLVSGDVTNLESVQSACAKVDHIFHVAGLISYQKSDRAKLEAVNVGGTRNVINAAKGKKLIHISSTAAVGAGFTPADIMNEDSPFNLAPLNIGYFQTKREAEILVLQACKQGLLEAVVLNPTTIYGFADAKKGSRRSQVKVAQGKMSVYTHAGVNVVAIEDVVSGILTAWQKGRIGERYILGSENMHIREVFNEIAKAAGVSAPQVLLPNFAVHLLGKLGDVSASLGLPAFFSRDRAFSATLYHWFNSDKARRELGFSPRPAREAIQHSVEWMRENGILRK